MNPATSLYILLPRQLISSRQQHRNRHHIGPAIRSSSIPSALISNKPTVDSAANPNADGRFDKAPFLLNGDFNPFP